MDGTGAAARAAPESGRDARAAELLRQTPLDRLEEAVKALKGLHAPEEVRRAMVARIAHAPFAEFETLKHIYLKHCGDAAR
jgi:hypothetical protein